MSNPIDLTDPNVRGNLSDGYHTFNELYDHRHILWINMLKITPNAWISSRHSDGSTFEGWFISGIQLPTGDVTYHLPIKYWNLIIHRCPNVELLEIAPEWDGHTSKDVLSRLLENIGK